MVQAARAEPFAVTGTRRHDQGEPTGRSGLDEPLLEGGVEGLRDAALDEPVVVTTSFSRISAIASSAEMTLFFLMEP